MLILLFSQPQLSIRHINSSTLAQVEYEKQQSILSLSGARMRKYVETFDRYRRSFLMTFHIIRMNVSI